jgi:hypothetical protein
MINMEQYLPSRKGFEMAKKLSASNGYSQQHFCPRHVPAPLLDDTTRKGVTVLEFTLNSMEFEWNSDGIRPEAESIKISLFAW